MLTPQEIRTLAVPSAFRTWLAIGLDWLGIALCFTLLVQFPHPITWVLGFIFMARQQLALAILMHDGAHRRFFKSAKLNDWVSQFFCAAPLLFSMYSYQKLHLKHHREPLAADDPDLSLIGGYPISKSSFIRKLARDAFGMSYFKFIRYFIYMSRQQKKPVAIKEAANDVGPQELKSQGSGDRLGLPVIAFSIMFVGVLIWLPLWMIGFGHYYFFFWILPAITALQVLLRIRGIAEHAGYTANKDQRLNARTVVNPVQTFFFAPHHVNFHIEHHVYPAIPCHNLPKLHRMMRERGMLPEQNIYPGYGRILSELVR